MDTQLLAKVRDFAKVAQTHGCHQCNPGELAELRKMELHAIEFFLDQALNENERV